MGEADPPPRAAGHLRARAPYLAHGRGTGRLFTSNPRCSEGRGSFHGRPGWTRRALGSCSGGEQQAEAQQQGNSRSHTPHPVWLFPHRHGGNPQLPLLSRPRAESCLHQAPTSPHSPPGLQKERTGFSTASCAHGASALVFVELGWEGRCRLNPLPHLSPKAP